MFEGQDSKSEAIRAAIRELTTKKIPHTIHNEGRHFKLGKLGRQVDYWPTTGKFWVPATGKKGFGLGDALRELSAFARETTIDQCEKPDGLNPCQTQAFALMTSAENVFLTGEAGTGKSYLVNQMRRQLSRHLYPIVAPTGVAALLVGGKTLHSFFGLGLFNGDVGAAVAKAMRDPFVKSRLRSIEGLFIDEVSMVSGPMLEACEEIARQAREDEEAWGGLKVIVVGDFRQLPPVNSEERGAPPEWAFLSEAWRASAFRPAVLKTPVRQTDAAFHKVLNRVRVGQVTAEAASYLNSRVVGYVADFEGTRLFARNAKVEDFNMMKLSDLPGELHVFETRYAGAEHHVNFLKRNAPIGDQLYLKVGAKVMLRRNDVGMRYVNGSLGTVTRITRDSVTIDLMVGEEIELWACDFEVKGDNDEEEALAKATNFPLSLAWATTIHKSQGCTLDKVLIDLRGLWESGQAYVALSRARSPEGVFLEGWDTSSIRADPVVTEFHKTLLKS